MYILNKAKIGLVAYRSIRIIVFGIFWNPEPAWSRNTSAEAVVIGGRNVPKEIIEQAYYYTHLLAIDHRVYIRISMQPWLPRGIRGYTVYQDCRDRGGVQQVHIFIRRQLTQLQLEKTLAHEMIHVEQFVRGRLVKCDNKYYRWNGGECVNIHRIPYSNRDWEQEAIKRGSQLYENFRRQKIAQVYNFPQIKELQIIDY